MKTPSPMMPEEEISEKNREKSFFLKKITKKFCQFKNSPYLCTRQTTTTTPTGSAEPPKG